MLPPQQLYATAQCCASLRPADILLRSFESGHNVALDLTICHGWQSSECGVQSRERWRSFLGRKERAKHVKYDAVCAHAGLGFRAMAFGTWGGQGPEGAQLLSRLVRRATAWGTPQDRATHDFEARAAVGTCLMRHVFRLLEAKNFIC